MTTMVPAVAGRRLRRHRLPLGRLTAFALLVGAAVALVLPLYWMAVNSFQPSAVTLSLPPELIPQQATLKNYERLYDLGAIGWTVNSLIVSIGGAAVALATALPAGYVFARRDFPGKDLLFALVLISMMMPWAVRLIPVYQLMASAGLVYTHVGMFIVEAAFPLGIFFARQYFQGLPPEVFDSARVDGASERRVFWSIVLPMSTPLIAVLIITAFFGTWTNYIWHLVMSNDSLYTLPVGVTSRASGLVSIDWGLQMAGATLALLPLFIIFIAFQRYFIKGVTFGAVNE